MSDHYPWSSLMELNGGYYYGEQKARCWDGRADKIMNFWHEDTPKWSDASTAQTISQSGEDSCTYKGERALYMRQDMLEVLLTMLLKH